MNKISQNIKLIAAIISFSFLFWESCAQSGGSRRDDGKRQSDYLPYTLDLTDLNGNTVAMSSFRNKVLFINIWATWCPPCRKEMPSIQALADRMQNPEVEFILMSPEDINKLSEFLKNNNLQLPVFSLLKQLPPVLRDEYIPRTYIVDRFGKIVHKHVGERDWNTQEIYEFINFLANTKVREN